MFPEVGRRTGCVAKIEREVPVEGQVNTTGTTVLALLSAIFF